VGEESKLARSFERLRSIVRKKRQGREKTDNEQNMRLEEMVCKLMTQHKAEKYYPTSHVHEAVIGRATENIEHSQQVDRMDHIAAGQNVEEVGRNGSGSGRRSPTFPRVVSSIVTGELEERKYSVSCHEALNKHAEDKRYSLALPKSVVSDMQESENDNLWSVSGQDTANKDTLSDQEDKNLRLSADKQLSVSTQHTGSKGETLTWPIYQCHSTIICLFFYSWRDNPLVGLGLLIHKVCFFLDHIQRHTTVGRSPLDE